MLKTFFCRAVGNALNGGNNNGFNNGFNNNGFNNNGFNNNGFNNNGFNTGNFNACGKRRKRQVECFIIAALLTPIMKERSFVLTQRIYTG